MQLRIKLLSDTLPGTGAGSVGGYNQEVTHHPNGLPFLPARRLKGCLREADLEVAEALSEAGHADKWNEAMVNELFGEPGQLQSAWLRLSNAELPDYRQLEDWLKWLAFKTAGNPVISHFDPEAVLQSYTTTRSNTSLSRVTGGPVDNTLRVSRLFNRQLIFLAHLDLIAFKGSQYSPAKVQFGLALACAAWRRMGTSRNRGWGEIEVVLEDETGQDLCTPALQELGSLMDLTHQ